MALMHGDDLDVAWDVFAPQHQRSLRAALDADDATWGRARGWAVQPVTGILYYRTSNPGIVTRCRRRLENVIADRALH